MKLLQNLMFGEFPTKFIIDKNQNIRFESVGYSGNPDELVEELNLMVSMIK